MVRSKHTKTNIVCIKSNIVTHHITLRNSAYTYLCEQEKHRVKVLHTLSLAIGSKTSNILTLPNDDNILNKYT